MARDCLRLRIEAGDRAPIRRQDIDRISMADSAPLPTPRLPPAEIQAIVHAGVPITPKAMAKNASKHMGTVITRGLSCA